jgi:aerobic carbon-monoxide dehydrogenase medium subunit
VKPAPFAYWDPDDLEVALAFLAEHGDESSILAGGQSLVPLLNMRLARPRYLIDLRRVPGLDDISHVDEGLSIGALCRQHTLAHSADVEDGSPLLTRALPHIGHAAIRYRGTIGGSLAHADPAAELPAVSIALDARLTLRRRSGTRTVEASDFFVSHYTTTIELGEVLTNVWLPPRGDEPTGTAVMELARRHGDFALVGVAVQITMSGETIGTARVCAFGVDEVPRRLREVETLVRDEDWGDAGLLREAGQVASAAVHPPTDMHASAEYRREMCGVLTERALAAAIVDAGAVSR